VWEAVQLMQQRLPSTHIVVLGLLPRGTDSGENLPAAQVGFGWPSTYTEALQNVNRRIK